MIDALLNEVVFGVDVHEEHALSRRLVSHLSELDLLDSAVFDVLQLGLNGFGHTLAGLEPERTLLLVLLENIHSGR
jgi:hypothetical protein